MKKTIFNYTTLTDWHQEGSYNLVEAISLMRDDIQNNFTIVIEQRYNNTPPDELHRFNTLEELDNWINEQFPELDGD